MSDTETSISDISSASNSDIEESLPTPKRMKKRKKTSENVKVICRFRPSNDLELENNGEECVEIDPDGKTLKFKCSDKDLVFEFDHVFDMNAGQEEVYKYCAQPLVSEVINGYNAAIIAYGQTGSGKTYTMQGPGFEQQKGKWNTDPKFRGIIPRMVDEIFEEIKTADPSVEFRTAASFVEIYKEHIRDLLTPAKDNLRVLEDRSKGLWITDATEVPVSNHDEVIDVLKQGLKNRFVAETKCNTESSRSHAIFLITIYKRDHSTKVTKSSQLYLVDLAGSEKVEKSGTTGERLEEAKKINTSLLALRNVIFSLTNPKSKHVPYRDSKLTRMLQNSFGGNSHTVLIVNCSPNSYNSRETLSTLRFGDRTRRIKNQPKENRHRTVEELNELLKKAKEEIEEKRAIINQLRKELAQYRCGNTDLTSKHSNGFDIQSFLLFFVCPITKKIMNEPCIAMDGHTYEKKAIEQYLKENKFQSPITKERLTSKLLIPNFSLRSQIQYFKQSHPKLFVTEDCVMWNLGFNIPNEILEHIFTYLDASSLVSAAKVCVLWKEVSYSNRLWKRLIKASFGNDTYKSLSKKERRDCRNKYWSLIRQRVKENGWIPERSVKFQNGLYLMPK